MRRLLQRTAAGAVDAYERLYREASPQLFAICRRILRDHGTAEEVLQEAWVAVWQHADNYDPAKAAPMTWLTTLARNKAIDRLRKRREEPLQDPETFPESPATLPGPVQMAQRSRACQRLDDCIQELAPERRELIREAFFSGATYKELAERLQVPLGTVKSWIRRSLLQLHACLER